jgi:lysophospholipase L1-like esterase
MASYTASAFRNSSSVAVAAASLLVFVPVARAQDTSSDRVQSLERQLAEQRKALKDWGGLIRYGSDNSELPPPAKGETRVVFLGDQITDFWGRRTASFFPGKPWLNRGIAGQTTDQMLVRFRQDVVSLRPKVVVILGGLNDIAGLHGPATEETVLDNLMSMTELAHANGIRVVLASVTPICDCFTKGSARQRWQERISEVNELIRKYCARSGATYLDYYSAMSADDDLKKDLTSDGVLPNDAGYGIMAPLAERAIAEALRGTTVR